MELSYLEKTHGYDKMLHNPDMPIFSLLNMRQPHLPELII